MDNPDYKLRHQINSHLAIILGYLQLLQKKHSNDAGSEKWLNIILQECEKLQTTLSVATDSSTTPTSAS